jgi:hypothetical protein
MCLKLWEISSFHGPIARFATRMTLGEGLSALGESSRECYLEGHDLVLNGRQFLG